MSKRFPSVNFITAVPSGASQTGTINIPPGLYWLQVYGTQTAASTAPTLSLRAFVSAAQSEVAILKGSLQDDSTWADAVDLDVAKTGLILSYSPNAPAVANPAPVYIPHGLQYVYTKNGGSAVNLTLVAVPAGSVY